jgi:hypothetical protein
MALNRISTHTASSTTPQLNDILVSAYANDHEIDNTWPKWCCKRCSSNAGASLSGHLQERNDGGHDHDQHAKYGSIFNHYNHENSATYSSSFSFSDVSHRRYDRPTLDGQIISINPTLAKEKAFDSTSIIPTTIGATFKDSEVSENSKIDVLYEQSKKGYLDRLPQHPRLLFLTFKLVCCYCFGRFMKWSFLRTMYQVTPFETRDIYYPMYVSFTTILGVSLLFLVLNISFLPVFGLPIMHSSSSISSTYIDKKFALE